MPQLAHRIAPHDELVRRAYHAGANGERMPDFGYLTGLSRPQACAINDAYGLGRRGFLSHRERSRP
jgi:hypothetical protein